MPLSKDRNRERMRALRAQSRLHKQLSPPAGANGVQPKQDTMPDLWVDADGNTVYNE